MSRFIQSLVNQDFLMWPWSAEDSPSQVVVRGLRCSCMIWSVAMKNAGAYCLVMPEQVLLVCCKCSRLLHHYLLHCYLMVSAKGCCKETRGDTF